MSDADSRSLRTFNRKRCKIGPHTNYTLCRLATYRKLMTNFLQFMCFDISIQNASPSRLDKLTI